VAGSKGRRQPAKTDRLDARHLRELLCDGRLPECWIPLQLVLETRAKVRLSPAPDQTNPGSSLPLLARPAPQWVSTSTRFRRRWSNYSSSPAAQPHAMGQRMNLSAVSGRSRTRIPVAW
jgi:hypothetical protein